jgi:hypothetical protein
VLITLIEKASDVLKMMNAAMGFRRQSAQDSTVHLHKGDAGPIIDRVNYLAIVGPIQVPELHQQAPWPVKQREIADGTDWSGVLRCSNAEQCTGQRCDCIGGSYCLGPHAL